MRVDLLRGALVEADEPAAEVVAPGLQVRSTAEVREVVRDRRVEDLFAEQVDLWAAARVAG